jgi:hypothetical protein
MTITLEKPDAGDVTLVELVKKGKRLYGAFYLFRGMLAYIAYRKQAEIFRAGEASISEALRKGTAAWALDEETLLLARSRGARFVGIMVKDTGDRYIARIERWFDRGRAKFINYERKGGSLQRCLPLSEFALRPGELKL